MYNQALYEQVLSKKHHAFRKPFDRSAASDFTNRDIAPVTRMAMRLRDVLSQETPHILDGQKIVYIRTVTDVPSIFCEDEWAEISGSHFIHELGYVSNLCADYGSTIKVGLDCRRSEAVARLDRAKAVHDAMPQKDIYWQDRLPLTQETILMPVPQGALDDNPTLVQNPGY